MPRNAWFKTPSVSQFILAFLIAPLLSLQASAQTQQPIFPITQFYNASPTDPTNIAVADFNGDGLPDIAFIAPPCPEAPTPASPSSLIKAPQHYPSRSRPATCNVPQTRS